MEEFTDEERSALAPFVTDIEKDVFVLTNLPEVIKGALFSRYSRSTKSLRRLLIDEFLKDPQSGLAQFAGKEQAESLSVAVRKAQAFYDRVLDGYGDDSVGELGGAHVAVENVSILATKTIQDARIGGSPLEKSTRYVWFDQKVDGDYLFFKDPAIMASRHKDKYLAICRKLFDAYAASVVPATEFVKENYPLDEFAFFDAASKSEIPFKDITDEKLRKRATIAYNASVRAKACDMLRGLLPAATLTNMGVFGNGRFFQGLLSRLYSQDLDELKSIGKDMHAELGKVIPSFVRRGARDEYVVGLCARSSEIASQLTEGVRPLAPKMVVLANYDRHAEDDLVAAILYAGCAHPLLQLRSMVESLTPNQKAELIADYVGERRHRRDKPGRAFEHIYYTFDILADYGLYRDLHRHRLLTQERQLLTTRNGFELPEEIVHAGLKDVFEECMRDAAEVFEEIAKDFPLQAQYVVPLAYKIRWYMRLNLREAFHLIELRSTPQGHPGYRKVVQLMFEEIRKVHPVLANHMVFVDMKDYPLGRIGQELRKEEKRERRESSR